MSMDTIIVLIVTLLVGCLIVWMLLHSWGRHRLRGANRSAILAKLKSVRGQTDPFRRLIELDAILDDTLRRLGYQGSLGEKLQKAGPYVLSLEGVWKSHKLRNHIAHEAGLQISSAELLNAAAILERAIFRFCR